MEKQIIFTTENLDNLKATCEKIISLVDENVDGNLMLAQLVSLGQNIKDFKENPIIKSSGIL